MKSQKKKNAMPVKDQRKLLFGTVVFFTILIFATLLATKFVGTSTESRSDASSGNSSQTDCKKFNERACNASGGACAWDVEYSNCSWIKEFFSCNPTSNPGCAWVIGKGCVGQHKTGYCRDAYKNQKPDSVKKETAPDPKEKPSKEEKPPKSGKKK